MSPLPLRKTKFVSRWVALCIIAVVGHMTELHWRIFYCSEATADRLTRLIHFPGHLSDTGFQSHRWIANVEHETENRIGFVRQRCACPEFAGRSESPSWHRLCDHPWTDGRRVFGIGTRIRSGCGGMPENYYRQEIGPNCQVCVRLCDQESTEEGDLRAQGQYHEARRWFVLEELWRGEI